MSAKPERGEVSPRLPMFEVILLANGHKANEAATVRYDTYDHINNSRYLMSMIWEDEVLTLTHQRYCNYFRTEEKG